MPRSTVFLANCHRTKQARRMASVEQPVASLEMAPSFSLDELLLYHLVFGHVVFGHLVFRHAGFGHVVFVVVFRDCK